MTRLRKSLSFFTPVVVGTAAFLYNEEVTAERHMPTPRSMADIVGSLVNASSRGLLLGQHDDKPEEFISTRREALHDSFAHVANVNKVLSERGVDIAEEEYWLIRAQGDVEGIKPGSPLDAALEKQIAQEFYNSYEKSKQRGDILNELSDIKTSQLNELRNDTSSNLSGKYLHDTFAKFKNTLFCMSRTLGKEEHELEDYATRYLQKRDNALLEIQKAVETSRQLLTEEASYEHVKNTLGAMVSSNNLNEHAWSPDDQSEQSIVSLTDTAEGAFSPDDESELSAVSMSRPG